MEPLSLGTGVTNDVLGNKEYWELGTDDSDVEMTGVPMNVLYFSSLKKDLWFSYCF